MDQRRKAQILCVATDLSPSADRCRAPNKSSQAPGVSLNVALIVTRLDVPPPHSTFPQQQSDSTTGDCSPRSHPPESHGPTAIATPTALSLEARRRQWETPACATDRIRQWETPPTAAVGFYHGRLQPPFASTGVTRTDRHSYANRPRSPRRANVSTEEQLYRYAPASRSIVGFYHGRLQPPFASTGVTRTDRHRYAGVCHSIPGMGPSPPLRSPAFHTDGIQL